MAEITTTYRGHEIRYGENSDEWYCSDLESGGQSHASLAKLKAKIDKMYLDLRKKAAVKAFEINTGYYEKPSLNETTVIEYVGQAKVRDYSKGGHTLGPHKVACVATRRGNDRPSRAEMEMSGLMPDTPEAHAAFAEALRLAEIAEAARKVAVATQAAVPRLSLDDIADLVKIKESEAA